MANGDDIAETSETRKGNARVSRPLAGVALGLVLEVPRGQCGPSRSDSLGGSKQLLLGRKGPGQRRSWPIS